MRFLLIIAISSITLIGCNKTSEITENNQPENAEIAAEASISVTTEITETVQDVSKDAETLEAVVPKASKTPSKQPKIQFNQKTFDFGMIEQGEKVQYKFMFTNTGDADLIIKDAQASCGCTTPSYPFVPIKPGETGSIGVTFSSIGKMGTQRPSITVTSTAQPRVTTLHLEGFVTDKLAKNELVKPSVTIDGKENVAKGGEIIPKEEPIIEEDNQLF
jgi:hypothetical protein